MKVSYRVFTVDLTAAVDSRELARFGTEVAGWVVLALTGIATLRMGQSGDQIPLAAGMLWDRQTFDTGLLIDSPGGGGSLTIFVLYSPGKLETV